jgi:hypothetical protein
MIFYKIHHGFIDETIKTLTSYFNKMYKKGIMRAFDTESMARAF